MNWWGMDWSGVGLVTKILLAFILSKILIGYHFPWEPNVKVRKRLRNCLEAVKHLIPKRIYKEMQEDVNKIN